MKVLISGASGLIGTALRAELAGAGHEVATLIRGGAGSGSSGVASPGSGSSGAGSGGAVPGSAPSGSAPAGDARSFGWDPAVGAIDPAAIEWADAVVNLSGAPIARLPWTRQYQFEIANSRVSATSTLARAISAARNVPEVFLTGTGISYYGTGPGVQTEDLPQGAGFLAEVVHRWEEAASQARSVTRVAFGRTGMVLAAGGVMMPLLWQARLGFGGRIGAGDTVWPWISLRDEVSALRFILENDSISGPVNLSAPVESTSGELTRAIASTLRRPYWFNVPQWAWKMAFPVAAEETMFKSQRAEPKVLLEHGFRFSDTDLESVVRDVLAR